MRLHKVIIIDGSNLLYRQLKQPKLWEFSYNGKRTGAVFGFFRSLIVILRQFKEYYPIIVFDKGRSARRLALYPNYKKTEDHKADRTSNYTTTEVMDEMQEELHRQGEVILAILLRMSIPTISIRGYEGDDIIAILAKYVADGVIVTDDKDMYQLLSSNLRIFRPLRLDEDGNKGALITFDKVKHPVYNNARSYVISKAIIGDCSDNIPKICAGIGEKKAEILCDYILSCNEDPEQYLPIMRDMKKQHFTDFVENHEQFLINKQLVDLSIIQDDPLITDEITTALLKVKEVPNFIELAAILGSEGIYEIDYQKLITHVMSTKKEVVYNG